MLHIRIELTPPECIIVQTIISIHAPKEVTEDRSALKDPSESHNSSQRSDECAKRINRIPQLFEMVWH
jgi:hypothetical protein